MPHLSNHAYNFNIDYVPDDMKTVLFEHYEVDWFAKLTQTTALSGQEGNKLQMYRLFINEIKCEKYLKCILKWMPP